jgi:hypothetical protein
VGFARVKADFRPRRLAGADDTKISQLDDECCFPRAYITYGASRWEILKLVLIVTSSAGVGHDEWVCSESWVLIQWQIVRCRKVGVVAV